MDLTHSLHIPSYNSQTAAPPIHCCVTVFNLGGDPCSTTNHTSQKGQRGNRNERIKLLSNKDKPKNGHLNLQSPQTQMTSHHCKNTINSYIVTTSYPTTASPEHYNTAEAQEKHLKTNVMKMIEIMKKEMKKIS